MRALYPGRAATPLPLIGQAEISTMILRLQPSARPSHYLLIIPTMTAASHFTKFEIFSMRGDDGDRLFDGLHVLPPRHQL